MREEDTVARFGGGFVLLIENISGSQEDAGQQIADVAETIRAALEVPYLLNQNEHPGGAHK